MANPIAHSNEIGGDFLGENVRVGKIVGVFEPFVPEPKDVDAGLIVDEKPACPLFPFQSRFENSRQVEMNGYYCRR